MNASFINAFCIMIIAISTGCKENATATSFIVKGSICNYDNSVVNEFKVGWKPGILVGDDMWGTFYESKGHYHYAPSEPPPEYESFGGSNFEIKIPLIAPKFTLFVETKDGFHGTVEVSNIYSDNINSVDIVCYPLEILVEKILFSSELQLDIQGNYLYVKDVSTNNYKFFIRNLCILEGTIDKVSVSNYDPILESHYVSINSTEYKFDISSLKTGTYTLVTYSSREKNANIYKPIVSVEKFEITGNEGDREIKRHP